MTDPVGHDSAVPRKGTIANLRLWVVCALAFVAMMVQDVVTTMLVIFEAHYEAYLGASMDVLGYLATLACSALALDSILSEGFFTRRSLTIVAVVSVANFGGTLLGVTTGALLTHH